MTRSLESSSIKPKVQIILASGSESRKQMLEEAGVIFDVKVSNTDEDSLSYHEMLPSQDDSPEIKLDKNEQKTILKNSIEGN